MERRKLDWARYYVFEKGYPVIPTSPKSKQPVIKGWKKFQKVLPGNEELEEWFCNGSKHSISIVTGKISGLAVVDLDSPVAVVLAEKMDFPEAPRVKTRRGYHLYYRWQEGIVNFQNRVDLPEIDLRGEGGYIIAPPSIHESGHQYAWVESHNLEDISLVDLPEIIVKEAMKKGRTFKGGYKDI